MDVIFIVRLIGTYFEKNPKMMYDIKNNLYEFFANYLILYV